MMLYDPHDEKRPEDIDIALERCKDMLSLIGGWAHLGNEYGDDVDSLGIDGVSLAVSTVEATLDHILMQKRGECERCQATKEKSHV